MCHIKCGVHPSAKPEIEMGPEGWAHLVGGPCQMARLPPLAFPMEEETQGQHKADS